MEQILISPEDLEQHNKSTKSDPTRVCISTQYHKKLKKYAANNEVSMQAVIECFVEKLPK
ncbi:MAG: DNA-binding protein [Gammaproteobacteria bacterium]|nr:DNA-binding protein [Gammaproteobacteria bacterium]